VAYHNFVYTTYIVLLNAYEFNDIDRTDFEQNGRVRGADLVDAAFDFLLEKSNNWMGN